MTDEFLRYHPIVNFIFYIAVLGFTMFQIQSVMVLISFICGAVYYFYIKGQCGLKYFGVILLIFVLSAIMNPLFSHRGKTLLFYLFTGNPVTLESVVYGLFTAAVIAAMLLWFCSFNYVMSSDKLMALTGKTMPHVTLLITMIMRFVPKYIRQQKQVREVKEGLGRRVSGTLDKIKESGEIFGITATWALETSVETADSMRARGYGAARRTNYHNYKITKRDILAVIWIVLCSALVMLGIFTGRVSAHYYPVIRISHNIYVYISYLLLCLTPIIINMMEAIKWNRLK